MRLPHRGCRRVLVLAAACVCLLAASRGPGEPSERSARQPPVAPAAPLTEALDIVVDGRLVHQRVIRSMASAGKRTVSRRWVHGAH